MHAAAGVLAGALGLALTAVLLTRDGFSRLGGGDGSADGFDAAGSAAVSLFDWLLIGSISLVLAGLGAGALLGGVMGRFDDQRAAGTALVLGSATLVVLAYALITL
jgi:hypothetical protein